MTTPDLVATPARLAPCIILIGMAGAGKSTVGSALARELGWAFLDSDHLIEALYGARLQDLTDALGKEAFLDTECGVIRAIKANRTVIGTGGSVVYREEAMRHLVALGSIVHLDVPLAVIEERVARNPQRGLAIAPGQTLALLLCMAIIPCVLMLTSYVLYKKHYKLDEDEYTRICAELEARKAKA